MRIEKLTTHIGAELSGVDLAEAARNDDLFAAIQDLRLERGAVNRALAAPAPASPEAWDEIRDLRTKSGRSLDFALMKLAGLVKDGFGED